MSVVIVLLLRPNCDGGVGAVGSGVGNEKEIEEDFPDRFLDEIRRLSENDEEMRALVDALRDGFGSKVGPEIKAYAKQKNQLSLDGNLILSGNRIVVPKKMRQEMLKRLHAAHQGIDCILRRAYQTVFGPESPEILVIMLKGAKNAW